MSPGDDPPLSTADEALALRWIEETILTESDRPRPLSPPAADGLDRQHSARRAVIDLIYQEPARAWRLGLHIARSSDHPWVLANLGAGLIEDLWFDPQCRAMRPGLEEAWRTNRNMRDAVQHVWIGDYERSHFPEAVAILEDLQSKHAETLSGETKE